MIIFGGKNPLRRPTFDYVNHESAASVASKLIVYAYLTNKIGKQCVIPYNGNMISFTTSLNQYTIYNIDNDNNAPKEMQWKFEAIPLS